MDLKSKIVIALSAGLIALWAVLSYVVYPPPPVPVQTNMVASATNSLGKTNLSSVTNHTTLTQTTATPTPEAHAASVPINPNAPESILTVTNADAIYTFSSHGGGLKLVELLKYPAATQVGKEVNITTNKYATLNSGGPVAAMTLLGGEVLQGDGIFQLTRTDKGVRVEKTLPNGLTITKNFQIGSNYLVTVDTTLENHSKESLTLPAQEWSIGTATPMSARDTPISVGFYYYNGEKATEIAESWFSGAGFLGCRTSTAKDHYEMDSKVEWADVHNQFFTMATMAKDPAQKVFSRLVELPNAREILASGLGGVTNGLETTIIYPHSILNAGQSVQKQFTIYAGPKEYNTLAEISGERKNSLDQLMGFGIMGFFAKMLLLSMNGLHALFGGYLNYGWIIIIITVLIKTLFWPLTTASTRSMKRMQALQPQIKALQEKYKDDPQKFSRKQMEFYKENKVNPVSGCLPMLIQIPVFIGFYTMIRSAIELRGVHFLWAKDLSQPDTIAYIGGFAVNLLPIIYGATALYTVRTTPPPPTADPSQAQTQAMMKYMPLIMPVMFYSMASGLMLYWTVQNLLTILQTKLTKTVDVTADGKTQVQIIPPKKKK